MLFNRSLDYVVNRIKYIPDKTKLQYYYKIKTKETNTIRCYEKKEIKLMHTGNKENNQYGYVPSCIEKWFPSGTVQVSTYLAL